MSIYSVPSLSEEQHREDHGHVHETQCLTQRVGFINPCGGDQPGKYHIQSEIYQNCPSQPSPFSMPSKLFTSHSKAKSYCFSESCVPESMFDYL